MQSVRSRTRRVPLAFLVCLAAACSDGDIISPETGSETKSTPGSTPPSDTTRTPAPVPTPAPGARANPFAGVSLYVDPQSRAARQADAWRSTRPGDAAELEKIAARPQADWFNEWASDIYAAVSARVTTITNAGALPVLVAYNIPKRDCNSYSAGGASSADAYLSWIRGFAAGIGGRKAVVILEPDALAGMGCLPAAEQKTLRTDLIREAVQILKANANTFVYLDGGHSNWHSAPAMAARLVAAGVAAADGFALNISNFQYTSNTINYGNAISELTGGKHFVFDSSRNGNGPGATWCNPDGRALGTSPTTNTGRALVDAVLWIKKPGESDGSCNGGPHSGVWWPDYALDIAARSSTSLYAAL